MRSGCARDASQCALHAVVAEAEAAAAAVGVTACKAEVKAASSFGQLPAKIQKLLDALVSSFHAQDSDKHARAVLKLAHLFACIEAAKPAAAKGGAS